LCPIPQFSKKTVGSRYCFIDVNTWELLWQNGYSPDTKSTGSERCKEEEEEEEEEEDYFA